MLYNSPGLLTGKSTCSCVLQCTNSTSGCRWFYIAVPRSSCLSVRGCQHYSSSVSPTLNSKYYITLCGVGAILSVHILLRWLLKKWIHLYMYRFKEQHIACSGVGADAEECSQILLWKGLPNAIMFIYSKHVLVYIYNSTEWSLLNHRYSLLQ